MEKASCVVCGNSYAFRRGKMYCSDSCKTRAHEKRKAGLPITGEAMRPKGSEISFDLAEYENVQKMKRGFSLPLDCYCFYRKNLPNGISVQRIADILEGYWNANKFDEEGRPTNDPGVMAAFTEFQKNFFAGAFEIIDSSAVVV